MSARGTLPAAAPPAPPPASLPGARSALALLLAINLFNYIDRQVLASVETGIEKTLFPDSEYPRDPATGKRLDPTIEGRIGSLNTAFMFSYMLIAPLFGWLEGRWSRWLLIGVGVVLWSLASGASGLAATFLVLWVTRCFVGIGEGAYGPVAPTLISDLFPVSRRGRALSWFYAAIPVGSALGYVLGGMVAGLTGDWRWAFYVVVPPGLLLGLLCFFRRDPPRGLADPGAGGARRARLRDYAVLLRTPSYVLNTLGMTAMTFAMGGIAFWMPRYVFETRGWGDKPTVNILFGLIVVVSGLGATLLGGLAGDKLRDRYPGSYFLVSGLAMLAGFPLVLLVLYTPFPAAWVFVFLACFCLFFNTGPTNTILANVTHPSIRAAGFGLNIFIIHALGDAISPPIIGLISGYFNLNVGFLVVSGMFLVSSLFWLVGTRYLARDTALAATRLGGPSKGTIDQDPVT
jgi:MFS family permease